MAEPVANRRRLAEIARQVRDGWVRGRGPLTGVKALVTARQEAAALEASEEYLAILDDIVATARAIANLSSVGRRPGLPAQLEASVARLQRLFEDQAA